MDTAAQRRLMIDRFIRRRGIRSERVLAAMEAVPREQFLLPELAEFAYNDRPLLIEAGRRSRIRTSSR
jgi:protein-L-isoaspartate(D-aspartate) O-methyltransferase